MSDVKICNNKKIIKLNDNFYMSPEGDVLKYKKYCIIHSCKKLASFNYRNEKIYIIFDFHIIDKDTFYKDLYFKDKVKNLILKHCKKNKNYKLSIYKYNQSVRGDLTNYWIEKFIDNISEIDDIDKLNLKILKI